MNIIIFIIILFVLVMVHEFGHFYSAKKFGIRVDEFGFGFPPKLFGKKYGETEYTLNALPFGGFVKIFGENPDDENTKGPDAARSFVNKPKWQQAIVLVAGIFANFVLAWILFSFGFMFGLPTSVSSNTDYEVKDINLVVVSVNHNSPAEKAGLKTGDKIVFIKSGELSTTFISPETVKSFVAGSGKDGVQMTYVRGAESKDITVIPEKSDVDSKPVIGIAMDQIGIVKLPFFKAFKEGMVFTWSVTKGTVSGLYGLIADGFKGKGSFEGVAGPVGLVGIVGDASKFGFAYLMSFTALISINLAVINIIPFPALDGGRLFFLLIEKIKGSRMNPNIANMANIAGFGILILLMLWVTYHDVVKLF